MCVRVDLYAVVLALGVVGHHPSASQAARALANWLLALISCPLTTGDAALAAALVAGGSLREFAEQSGKKQSTVRSQLLSIFRKTNTARQIELVQLLKQ